METRASRKRKIDDSGLGQNLDDPENSQISLVSNTRYKINYIQFSNFFFYIFNYINYFSNNWVHFEDDFDESTDDNDDDDSEEDDENDDENVDDVDEEEYDDDDGDDDDDSEEEEDDVEEEMNWSEDSPELIPLPFEGPTGPTFEKLRSPLDYFRKLFTEDLLDRLRNETIKYAQRKNRDFTLNIVELEAFLGVTMTMSMIRVPFIEDYWSNDNSYGQKQVYQVFSLVLILFGW